MKKEVKIGLAGIGALLILFFGINYLKGISMFKPESYYYVDFTDVNGLAQSSPVFANGYKKEKYEYKIKPIFGKQNFLKICIDCIINLKMVHIINIIYILKKKRSVNKYDKRTSDRRAYAYSNE